MWQQVAQHHEKVQADSLFVCYKGVHHQGHQYMQQATERGASVVLCEKMPHELLPHVAYVQVENARKALAELMGFCYGNCSAKLQLIGVTGTNGKSSVVTLLYEVFKGLGHKVGLLSTLVYKVGEETYPATHTTPDAMSLHQYLQKMVKASCRYCFMEVSSHALAQYRTEGLVFAGGVFTNITHDHLDYHGNFTSYLHAKKRLLDALPAKTFALVNADDTRSAYMCQNTQAHVKTYSLKNPSDYKAHIIENTSDYLLLGYQQQQASFRLLGKENAYNITAALGVAELLDQPVEEVLRLLSSLPPVKGRLERVYAYLQAKVYIDYCHTPDALERSLANIKTFCSTPQERIITVVGCGGNRDKAKRPVMGKIAVERSHQVIFTSDNPRQEEPADIIRDMQQNLSAQDQQKCLSIVNRKEAISVALKMATPKDYVLIAGKGHEDYQEIKGVRQHFSDQEIVQEIAQTYPSYTA